LDYRLPVYEALDRLCGGQLSVVYYSGVVPRHCQERLKEILGDRAIGLSGEVRLSGKKQQPLSQIRGNGLRIPLQPGLVKVLRSTQPDLILADGFFQWTYGALWMRLFHGIPLVMCYEGTRHTERNAGFLRTGYRRLAARAIDRIVCNGSLSREYIEQLGFPKEKIGIGNMAADIQRFEAQALQPSQSAREALRQQLGVEGKILLFVGRLVPVKGLDKLLEGWKRAFGAGQGATLLIVGEGPQKKELQAYCRANRLGNVRFAGAVDHQEIPTYFSLADVFIIPT